MARNSSACEHSRQSAAVVDTPRDHADAALSRQRQQRRHRPRFEDIEDHLHAIDQAGAHDLQHRIVLVILRTDGDAADLSLFAQSMQRVEPRALVRPQVVPLVQVNDVELLDAKRTQAPLHRFADTLRRIGFGDRTIETIRIAARGMQLGRDDRTRPAPGAQRRGDQLFGFRIHARGIDQRDPALQRAQQRRRDAVANLRICGERHRAVGDGADVEAGLAVAANVQDAYRFRASISATMRSCSPRPMGYSAIATMPITIPIAGMNTMMFFMPASVCGLCATFGT